MARKWTQEDLNYLEEHWGALKRSTIANNLNRSVSAVMNKAQRIGLGDPLFHLDGSIGISELSNVLNVHYGTVRNWIDKYGFPAKRKIVANQQKVSMIKYSDFWKWAETHKHMMNFARLEKHSLGPEPEWVEVKRSADRTNHTKKLKKKWTDKELSQLKGMANALNYSYSDMAERIGRSESAIKRKLYDLNLPNPVRMPPIKWTEEQVQTLLVMYKQGYGMNTISERIGKGSLAIRAKMEQMGYTFMNGVPQKIG